MGLILTLLFFTRLAAVSINWTAKVLAFSAGCWGSPSIISSDVFRALEVRSTKLTKKTLFTANKEKIYSKCRKLLLTRSFSDYADSSIEHLNLGRPGEPVHGINGFDSVTAHHIGVLAVDFGIFWGWASQGKAYNHQSNNSVLEHFGFSFWFSFEKFDFSAPRAKLNWWKFLAGPRIYGDSKNYRYTVPLFFRGRRDVESDYKEERLEESLTKSKVFPFIFKPDRYLVTFFMGAARTNRFSLLWRGFTYTLLCIITKGSRNTTMKKSFDFYRVVNGMCLGCIWWVL